MILQAAPETRLFQPQMPGSSCEFTRRYEICGEYGGNTGKYRDNMGKSDTNRSLMGDLWFYWSKVRKFSTNGDGMWMWYNPHYPSVVKRGNGKFLINRVLCDGKPSMRYHWHVWSLEGKSSFQIWSWKINGQKNIWYTISILVFEKMWPSGNQTSEWQISEWNWNKNQKWDKMWSKLNIPF